MPDYLLAAHIQVTGGAEAAAQLQQVQVQINNFSNAAKTAGTGQMAGDFEKASQSGGLFSKVIDQAGTALIRMATYRGISAVVSGIHEAADAVLSFDAAMTNSLSIQQGVTGTMRADMESLAETIAVRLGEAPGEVAKGFYYLASAGLTVDQQMADLPIVANFAKAGLMDLDQATEMLFDSLTALGLKVDDPMQQMINLREVSDLLTEAAIRSQGEISDFGAALANKAGADIKSYGINLKEGIALLEVFADRGIKGAKAGTAFDQVIRDLTIKAVGHADAFKKLGIEVFDAEGNLNSLVTIFKQVDAALLHLPLEDRTKALKDMGFTLKSGQLIQGLLGTSTVLEAFKADLENAGGTAARVAATQMESLRAKLDQLKAAFQVGAIEGFQKLVEFGNWLAAEFRPAIEAIMPAAQAMGQGIATVAEGFLALAVAIGRVSLEGIAMAIQHIGEFASQHTGAVQVFGFALASLAGAKVLEAIGGLGAALGTNLLGRLNDATVMLRVIGSEMADVLRSGGGIGKALSTGLAGLGEMINPVTIALAAAAATIGVFWKTSADNAREARQAVSDLANAIGTQLGVSADEASIAMAHLRDTVVTGANGYGQMADAAREALADAVAQKVASEGQADAFHKLGITTYEVAAAMATGTDVFGRWRDTALSAHGTTQSMHDDLDKLPASVRPIADALLKMTESGQISFTEFLKLTQILDGTADSADDLTGKFAEMARKTLGEALVTGQIDEAWLRTFGIMEIGTATTEQLMHAMDALGKAEADTPANANRMGEGARLAKEKLDEQTKATEDAEAAMKRFNDSLKELGGGLDKDFSAFTAAGTAIANLVDSMQGVPVSFDGTTEASRNQRDALQGAAGAAIKLAEAHAAATQSADQGAAAAMGYSLGLADVMRNAGLTEVQVESLLEQFGLTPDEIRTLFQVDTTEATDETKATEQRFHDLAVEAANAQLAIDGVKKALDEFTVPSSLMAATARMGDKMLDFQDAANKYVKDAGPLSTAFTDHTRAANGLVEQLDGLIQGQKDFAKTMLDQGRTQEAIDGMTNLKNTVYDLLKSYGLTEDEIAVVLKDFGLTDEAIAKLKPGVVIPVSQNGAEAVGAVLDHTALPNGQARVAVITSKTFNAELTSHELDNVADPGGIARGAVMYAFGANITGTWEQLNQTANPGNGPRQSIMWAIAASGALGYVNSQLNNLARARTVYIDIAVRGMQASIDMNTAAGNVPRYPMADGGVLPAVHAFASGGFENHVAQIQWGGPLRLWAEPETGGEAYIPLSPGKRAKSVPIWEETGRRLGVQQGGPTVNIHSPTSVTINGSGLSPEELRAAVTGGVDSANAKFARALLTELQTR